MICKHVLKLLDSQVDSKMWNLVSKMQFLRIWPLEKSVFELIANLKFSFSEIGPGNAHIPLKPIFLFKVGLSLLRKFLPNWNFPQPSLKKYHHLFFWCLKLKINEFSNCKICFLKKQADLKRNCTRLWRCVLMITYNMLSRKYYFY